MCDVVDSSVDVSVAGKVPQESSSETAETSLQKNQDSSDASSESVSVDVPSADSREIPMKTEADDTCVNETRVEKTASCSKVEIEEIDITDELQVKKNKDITRENCILTEPDNVENVANKQIVLRQTTQSSKADLKSFPLKGSVRKGEQEHERQLSSSQTSTLNHHGQKAENCSNNRASTSQTFVETRTCFRCRKVGHVLANCNYKDGKVSHVQSNDPHMTGDVRRQRVQVDTCQESKLSRPQRRRLNQRLRKEQFLQNNSESQTVQNTQTKLSRPQRRRLNKRLRKEQLLKNSQNQTILNDKEFSVKVVNNINKQNGHSKGLGRQKVSGVESSVHHATSSKSIPTKAAMSVVNGQKCKLVTFSYINELGQPKTTSAWVPLVN
jgi:hypothetical protein